MPQYDWPPKPLPSVTAALRDADSKKASFRRLAAIALRRAEEPHLPAALEALRKLLADTDRTVRIEAAATASHLGESRLLDAILPLLSMDDPDQRIAALDYLSSTAGPSEASHVEDLLDREGDAFVRCTALEALYSLEPRASLSRCLGILERGDEQVPVLRTALAIRRTEGLPSDAETFARYLEDGRPGVSLEAAASLAHLGDPRGTARLLEEALHPRRAEERLVALEALCRMAGADVLEAARKRLRHVFAGRDEKLYWRGILASEGDADALGRLVRVIDGSNTLRAATALRVAGLCSLTPLVERLADIARRGLGGDEDALCAEAIEALGLMRCRPAARALADLLEAADDEQVRDHVRAALEEVEHWTEGPGRT